MSISLPVSIEYHMFRNRDAQCEEEIDRKKKYFSSLSGADYDPRDKDINNIETSTRRKKTWNKLYNPALDYPPEPPLIDKSDTGADIFFNNIAARSAYITFFNYIPSTNEFVLSLARADADAWFTACTWFVSLPNGKGRNRNTQFEDVSMFLLLRCLFTIIGNVYSVILQNCGTELTFPNTDDFVPTLKEPTLTHFKLRAKTRNDTTVVYMPSDQHYYIIIQRCA